MGLLLLLPYFFFLLITAASPLRDVRSSSCSSKFLDELLRLNSSGIHLPLHHPQSPCSPAPSPSLPFSDILSHDDARVRSLAARLSKSSSRLPPSSSSSPLLRPDAVSVPLYPGASLSVGNYVTRIGLGTPARSYAMVVDTGSSLSWLQCSPCRISCHAQSGPVFDPTSSATYRSVSCSSSACAGLESATLNPAACSNSGDLCIYQASYGDSSFSVGYLSTDTLSLPGSSEKFSNFVYGCGEDNEGLFGRSAGLIGLARNKLSLLSQLAPKLGNSFAYCLPSASSSGFLSIGSYDAGPYTFAPMQSSSLDDSLFFIKLASIAVAGRQLPVSSSAYGAAPTIIDSGTVITRLPPDVYNALSAAVAAALKGRSRAPAYSILDTCFRGKLQGLAVPAVEMVFEGGAKLKLAPRNAMIEVDDSTTCLAFAPAGRVAIIGNKQQETYSVVYDVGKRRIGFAAGGCS